MASRNTNNIVDRSNNNRGHYNSVDWKEEPYRAALTMTGSKVVAMEILMLAEWIREIGLTEYPEMKLIEGEMRV